MMIKKLLTRSPKQLMNLFRTKFGRFSSPVCSHDPTEIMVFITTRCNFSCNTCPFTHESPYSPPPGIADITPEFFQKIVDEYRGATIVGLVGGEPLLHPHLDQLIQIAHSRRMTTNLSTNGSLLSPERSRQLLDQPLGFLNISLDASNAKDFLATRRGSDELFKKILRNATAFAEIKAQQNSPVKLLLSIVTHTGNLEDIPDFARLAKKIGADQVFCQNVLSYQCSDLTDGGGSLRDLPEIRQRLAALKMPDGISVVLPALVPVDEDCKCVRCKHPFTNLALDGSGNLSPCCVIPPHPKYGNIADDVTNWRTVKNLQTIRSNMLAGKDAFEDICLDCWERFSLGSHED